MRTAGPAAGFLIGVAILTGLHWLWGGAVSWRASAAWHVAGISLLALAGTTLLLRARKGPTRDRTGATP
ncbi:MAG TPA: hypothetical protein VNL37_05435, partial [Candidatus Polarisedimenticolia bacterium]|nr:hypothetical protein [Candidatus Polarisedimenticolia bacterium]